MTERVVLAHSGGLDTSVAIGWIAAETGAEVIAVAADVGQGGEDPEVIRKRALACGAVEAEVADAREESATGYCLPALQADALYLDRYPLVPPLRRALDGFVAEANAHVTGDVRLRLHGGRAVVTGRRSPHSLYDFDLATYDSGDTFDQSLARGFMQLWGLPSGIAARRDQQLSGPAR